MTRDEPPCEDLIRQQMERLACSAVFSRSVRLLLFLRFVVEETLAGRGGSLKELVVGDRLYSAHAPYDPRIDSAVRVGAREIRRKLACHYKGAGASDPVRIDLPPGSYRPVFTTNCSYQDQPGNRLSSAFPFTSDLPAFTTMRGDEAGGAADTLSGDLVFALKAGRRLDRIPGGLLFQLGGRTYALCEVLSSDAALGERNEPDHKLTVELAGTGGIGGGALHDHREV